MCCIVMLSYKVFFAASPVSPSTCINIPLGSRSAPSLTYSSLSQYILVQYFYVGLLLIGVTTLVLFFATGMYTEKIAYAHK